MCVLDCPSGLTPDAFAKACIGPGDFELCFLIDHDATNVVTEDYSLVGGATDQVEQEDPVPLYQRGFYFDGVSSFASILD